MFDISIVKQGRVLELRNESFEAVARGTRFPGVGVHTSGEHVVVFTNLANQQEAINAMESCIRDIKSWMYSDKLDDDKTEFIIIGTRQQLSKVKINNIVMGESEIKPVSSVRNLGAWFDDKCSMAIHITKMCSSSFYHLHNIRRIRNYLSQDAAESWIHSFITCRVDYCNSLLYGVPAYQLEKLQRVQNAAARLIFKEHKFCHITPLLQNLHWLPVKFRINFKILLITFKAIHGLAPMYVQDLMSTKLNGRYALRSSSEILLKSPAWQNFGNT